MYEIDVRNGKREEIFPETKSGRGTKRSKCLTRTTENAAGIPGGRSVVKRDLHGARKLLLRASKWSIFIGVNVSSAAE